MRRTGIGLEERLARSLRDRLVRMLLRERAAARDEIAELHSLPLEERLERGCAIAGLRFRAWEDGGDRLLMDCPENLSRFRAGEKLTLGNGADPERGAPVTYAAYDPIKRLLRVEKDRWRTGGWDLVDLEKPLVLDRSHSDFTEAVLAAVDAVYLGDDQRCMRIRSILEREAIQRADGAEQAAARRMAPRLGFDDAQEDAFVRSFSTGPFQLVLGPPGSGKTHLIAHLAAAWAAEGKRVLVTAYTHRAVNNALSASATISASSRESPAERSHSSHAGRWGGKTGATVQVVRCGEGHHADDLPPEVARVRSARGVVFPTRGGGLIAGATVFALKGFWGEAPFDRVVFDEAAQIPVPHAVCGMLAGERYLFVGDDRQLGPIVSADHEDPIASASIFSHLAGGVGRDEGCERRYEPTLLRHTYRMNEGINQFPSRSFYSGVLESHRQAAVRRFSLLSGGLFDEVLDPAQPAVLVLIGHEGHRTRSWPEARLVSDLTLDLLVRQGMDPADLAIVTPYRAQVRAIRSLLQQALQRAGRRSCPLPVIDTVERMQGQQREAVIVSLVCSEPEYAAREASFLFSPNRLNVTLTRARTKLVVVASPLLFEALPPSLDDLRKAGLFVRLQRQLPKVDFTARYGAGQGLALGRGEPSLAAPEPDSRQPSQRVTR